MVVSGSNIAMVWFLFQYLLYFQKHKWNVFIVGICVFMYVAMVGFEPPVMRAFIMIIPSIVARLFGRESHVIDNLLMTVVVLILINPLVLKNISFQLSFLATFGLIIISPVLNKMIALPKIMKEVVVTSLSAQIFTLPITVYYFQELSIVSLLVNILVLPAVAVITFGGILLLIVVNLSTFIGQLLGGIMYFPLTYFVRMINFWGALPQSSWQLQKISFGVIAIYYIFVFCFIYWFKYKEQKEYFL